MEYTKRLMSLKKYSEMVGLKIIYDDSYDLEEFLKRIADNPVEPYRCFECYTMRLNRAAQRAAENGFKEFTTTLTVSIYQDHNLIRDIGEEVAKKHRVSFVYFDFRDGYRQGHNKAREMGLYMQQYCGCVYSERDRFIDMKPEKIVRKY